MEYQFELFPQQLELDLTKDELECQDDGPKTSYTPPPVA